MLTLNGVYVDKKSEGDWRVFRSPSIYPPAGSMSSTSYLTQNEALKAAKEGKYD